LKLPGLSAPLPQPYPAFPLRGERGLKHRHLPSRLSALPVARDWRGSGGEGPRRRRAGRAASPPTAPEPSFARLALNGDHERQEPASPAQGSASRRAVEGDEPPRGQPGAEHRTCRASTTGELRRHGPRATAPSHARRGRTRDERALEPGAVAQVQFFVASIEHLPDVDPLWVIFDGTAG
jgi:hypothetical protein